MSINPKPLIERLQQVHARIGAACTRAGRDPSEVNLLAVSKNHPAGAIATLQEAGQHAFGESYAQEGVEKIRQLGHSCQWHFIGPLQSNKTTLVASMFDWVHSLDRIKIAERLSRQRPQGMPPLQVCIQVNISQEASKGGVSPSALPELAQAVAQLPGVTLRGLMTIPRPCESISGQRQPFHELRLLYDSLRQQGMPLDTLSMGMSADLEAAIAEGSTLVRIGSALFGPRPAAGTSQ